MPSHPRDRSVSGELDDSDLDSPGPGEDGHDNGSGGASGKPGRKKNPNSQAARRDQNRIAQREFRLRKQQRIRDLEASVEILSGGKDEALNQMRKIMKDLMQENQVLRGLLRSLSGFIGDGAGGVLPKMGWDLNDFNAFINRSETDTAWESYQRQKRDQQHAQAAGPSKRSADDDVNGSRKRPRGTGVDDDRDGYSLLVPMNPAAVPPVPAGGLYPQQNSASQNILNELLRGPSGSPMFVPPTSPPNSSSQYPTPTATSVSAQGFSSSSYIAPMNGPMNLSVESPVNTLSVGLNSNMPGSSNGSAPNSQAKANESTEPDPKTSEAMKLIHYHLENYKRNSQYCLPSSLRPTLVQRTIPHESIIDGILHPELRDRMILLRGRFDLVDCMHDLRTAVTIHGDDVLAHSNWEISPTWLQSYKFLVGESTLNHVNRWRRDRGDTELPSSDYASAEPNLPA
ncbi:hypothetical protein QCA50_000323 [Cerrena zonata]|uniref:BZIP domain-containing protein n=1 Tax=Cerrena zonata TaxID=2478898 RepID=A0AAW0GUB6_9APHY